MSRLYRGLRKLQQESNGYIAGGMNQMFILLTSQSLLKIRTSLVGWRQHGGAVVMDGWMDGCVDGKTVFSTSHKEQCTATCLSFELGPRTQWLMTHYINPSTKTRKYVKYIKHGKTSNAKSGLSALKNSFGAVLCLWQRVEPVTWPLITSKKCLICTFQDCCRWKKRIYFPTVRYYHFKIAIFLQ